MVTLINFHANTHSPVYNQLIEHKHLKFYLSNYFTVCAKRYSKNINYICSNRAKAALLKAGNLRKYYISYHHVSISNILMNI